MESTWDLIRLPDSLRTVITTIALALALAPFLPGIKIVGVEIPKLEGKTREVSKVIGPLCFMIAILAFIPIWPTAMGNISGCGFFSDEWGPAGEWLCYSPSNKGRERFWVGCRVTANVPLTIDSIRTAVGISNGIYVGLNPQKYTDTLTLSAKESEWVAIPVETSISADVLSRFHDGSQIALKVKNTDVWLVGKLPALAIPVEK